MISEEEALWAAQVERPDDTLLMLVCADKLAELGRDLEGECLRLLGETGKTGKQQGYWGFAEKPYIARVPRQLEQASYSVRPSEVNDIAKRIPHRRLICRAWAEATEEERRGWEKDIRHDHLKQRIQDDAVAVVREEIAKKGTTRDAMAELYRICMELDRIVAIRNGGLSNYECEINWPAINAAIIARWSRAGLEYIKKQAWKLVQLVEAKSERA